MNNDKENPYLSGLSALDDDERKQAEDNFDDGKIEPEFDPSLIKEDLYSEENSSHSSDGEKSGQTSQNKQNQQPNHNKNFEENKNKKPLKKKLTLFSLKVFAAGFVILALLFVYFDSVVLSKFGVDDKWVLPAVVYSRPLELYPDQKLSLKQMQYELSLLKYRKVPNPQYPGEYAVNEKLGRVVIIRRPFEFPDASEGKISIMVEFNGQRISQILNADTKEELGYIRMDPVLLDRINRIDPKEDRIFGSILFILSSKTE